MGDQNFYIGNRGSAFLDNVITGFIIYTIYKGLYSYRKWFGVLSFQRNNRNNENGQSNNENPLYMRVDILVSADPFLDRKATLQQNTTSSDFRFAICCQISINCTLSTPHVRNLTARKNQAHKRRRHNA